MLIVCCFFLLLVISTGVLYSQSADTQGFVSIDCGYTGDSYTDPATDLVYTSDADYTEGVVSRDVPEDYIDSRFPVQQLLTVRSFPDGSRNCYTIPKLTEGAKYLIRASFLYGNHDGINSSQIHFNLYLGVNLWTEIRLTDPNHWLHTEVLTVAESSSMSVCLVRTSSGGNGSSPFISSLELRPLPNSIYPAVNASNWLVLNSRQNIGRPLNDPILRYPDDAYDRLWNPYTNPAKWDGISTTLEVKNPQDDYFLIPTKILQTAAVPAGNGTALSLAWVPSFDDGTVRKYHIFMHFAEIQYYSGGARRIFNVMLGGNLFSGPLSLDYYLKAAHVFTNGAQSLTYYNLSIQEDGTSAIPPLLSGLETYWLMNLDASPTDKADVDAIMDIKGQYNLKRNWMGDPCAPRAYAWDGLNCTYATASASPRIIALNLSSSDLTGEIPASLANLKELTTLDLSTNSLHGEIPDFLGDMTSLKYLNLTGNDLSGPIPSTLLQRSTEGSLTLSFEGNRGLCTSGNQCQKKKKWIIIVVICPIVALLLAVGILLIVFYVRKVRRRKQQGNYPKDENFIESMDNEGTLLPFECRQFTYSELQTITKHFQDKLGEGGFGTVFHGTLENGAHVAVKIRHQLSSQGVAQLMTEVKLLSRKHHKNLATLVGYCNEKIYRGEEKKREHIEEYCLALIYEYMPQGDLEEYLRLRGRELCWRERLRIAAEAAKGLDYLHNDCNPPIVHRDVKTSNILLDDKLLAKLDDFGFSRAFSNEAASTQACTTSIIGTTGYVDPEYQSSSQLTKKSDVYSFGVVLLELITGRPAATRMQNDGTIIKLTEWSRERIDKMDIAGLADARLKATGGSYSIDSLGKAVDIATRCIAASSTERPDMASVVVELNEALKQEQVGNNQRKFFSALGESEQS